MLFSTKFISATAERASLTKSVHAPYLRRDLVFEKLPESAKLTVCGLGFYELYVNGKNITRGRLSPYIVNPDQVLPYDFYDILPYLVYGENTIAFILGNGMQNAFGGFIWSFDKNKYDSAPKLAFALELKIDGEYTVTEADERVLTHPSPIWFDDLRMGEKYDARKEIPNWNLPGCDTSDWTPAIAARADAGEEMQVDAKPIIKTREIAPVSITREGESYIYDFGENNTGLTRLHVNGTFGQHITVDHGEWIKDGVFTQQNILFTQPPAIGKPKYTQRTEYICRGGDETYTPKFTYYGFRYAKVSGITEEQATPELLTYEVMSTDLGSRGDFVSSNETLNTLQEMTRRSTVSNFLHFPVDCPHREKNGWTADAALSAEQTTMNFAPEDNYLMWIKCLCRALTYRGVLPGIVPTGKWGHSGCNGPAWDQALIHLPYISARLRGDLRAAREAAPAMLRYLHYLRTRMDERGLLSIGLGDWCSPGPRPSNIITDSIISYSMGIQAAYLFRQLGMELEAEYCDGFAAALKKSIREHLIEDRETVRMHGDCQTSQAMAIYYGILDTDAEREAALKLLLQYIHDKDDHLTTGVLGARVMFRVMCDYGYQDLAVKLITRPDPPSYGFMIEMGYTTLTEKIVPSENSFNHHFFGDISALMIEYLAGIRINPDGLGANTVLIAPTFPSDMSFAEAHHDSVCGEVRVRWEKESDGRISLYLTLPLGISASLRAPVGYSIADALPDTLTSGTYTFLKN